uniref:Uncharacterized protein n=1 Tax=Oryza punctata TaxID=4537 RepID=A0A0E0MBP3_ORYPU
MVQASPVPPGRGCHSGGLTIIASPNPPSPPPSGPSCIEWVGGVGGNSINNKQLKHQGMLKDVLAEKKFVL